MTIEKATQVKLDAVDQAFFDTLDRRQKLEYKNGRASIIKCSHCGKPTLFGGMNLISLAISRDKPVCSYECNKALGQIT